MDTESLPGESLPDGTFVADRWMTFLWAEATQNSADAYRYAAATDDSATAPLIPPAFAATLAIDAAGGINAMMDLIDIPDGKDIFHGEQRMDFEVPLRVDVSYGVSAKIAAVDQKEGQRDLFHIITIDYQVTGPDDDIAMELSIGAVVR